jgi:hypothetical protein
MTPMADRVAALLAELNSFGNLTKGWNGYSAPPPTSVAINNAEALVIETNAGNTVPVRVEPSAMGGIGVTFAAGSREVVVEFYNNGTAHALFADNATEEMDTRPIAPLASNYRGFLVEVHQYLYGHKKATQTRYPDVSRF